jgi:hypothetical protein
MPQDSSTHSRKPKREKRPKQERHQRTHEEPHFNVGAPRTPRRVQPGSPGGRPRTRRPDVSDAGAQISYSLYLAIEASIFFFLQAQFQTILHPPLMKPLQLRPQIGMSHQFHRPDPQLPTPPPQTGPSLPLSSYPLYRALRISLWSLGHFLILPSHPSRCDTVPRPSVTLTPMETLKLSLLAMKHHRQPHRSRIALDTLPRGAHS